MIDHYDWPGGREAMLRFGPAAGPVVIAALPLFEEANRTRAFVVTILRALAERGIAGVLPDLPGTGESLVVTEDATLSDWRLAFSSVAGAFGERPTYGLAIRGGALLDTTAALAGRWHQAPASGAAIVRDLLRTRLAVARDEGESFDPAKIAPPGPPIELAGNRVSRALLAEVQAAEPVTSGTLRTVRSETDPLPADRKLTAAPLWRRSEPDNDVVLAALLAEDIAGWIARCAAC